MFNFLLSIDIMGGGASAPPDMFENKAFSETDIITCALIFIIVVLMAIATLALGKKYGNQPQDEENEPDNENQSKSDE